jgi:hypothetical protein
VLNDVVINKEDGSSGYDDFGDSGVNTQKPSNQDTPNKQVLATTDPATTKDFNKVTRPIRRYP